MGVATSARLLLQSLNDTLAGASAKHSRWGYQRSMFQFCKTSYGRVSKWLHGYLTHFIWLAQVIITLSGIVLSEDAYRATAELCGGTYKSGVEPNDPEMAKNPWIRRRPAVVKIAICCLLIAGSANIPLMWMGNKRSKTVAQMAAEMKQLSQELEVLVNENGDLRVTLAENLQSLTSGYLMHFARKRLQFGEVAETCERITLYVYDEEGGNFVPFGRYCDNFELQQINRPCHPANEGCIAHAWLHRTAFDADFPNPESSKKEYPKRHKRRWKMSPDSVAKLRMKSRLYYASRIDCIRNNTGVAVLVIEATSPERFTEPDLRAAVDSDVKPYLSELVQTLRPHIALPSIASRLGL